MKDFFLLTAVYAAVAIVVDCMIWQSCWKHSFKVILNYDGYKIFDKLSGANGVRLMVIWFPKKIRKGRETVYRVMIIS